MYKIVLCFRQTLLNEHTVNRFQGHVCRGAFPGPLVAEIDTVHLYQMVSSAH